MCKNITFIFSKALTFLLIFFLQAAIVVGQQVPENSKSKEIIISEKNNFESDYSLEKLGSEVNFNINYNLMGATNSPENPNSYSESDSVYLNPATKTNYTFEGWFTDSTFTNPISEISTGTTGDIELWAKFDSQITYVIDLEQNMFSLYPNPAYSQVVIGTDLSQPIGEILITDMTGKIVKQFQTQKSTTEIDISTLENGIYFVKAGGVSQKLVKK